MDPQANPFAVLSLIAAPAILTNACSLLAMSTSNRLARAVDRARELAKQLEEAGGLAPLGLGALVHGSILLVRETRLVVQVLHERAQSIRALASSAERSQGVPRP